MALFDLFLIAVGLSMDAFAVSVGKGLSMRRLNLGQALVIALFFGGFQALMPFLGWLLGAQFTTIVDAFAGWIAFMLLAFVGGKMIWDALREGEKQDVDSDGFRLDLRELFALAIATSIDAFAAGVAFALLEVNIAFACSFIGATTFLLSFAGVAVGHQFGNRWEKPSAIVGGIVLILIGLKTLLGM